MESEEIRKIVKEILDLVVTLPEEYRISTYEVLLTQRLLGSQAIPTGMSEEEKVAGESWNIIVPIDVKAFLKTHEMSEDVLKNLFLANKSEIARTYEIVTTKKATAQIQIACLTALEHALRDGVFRFSIEEIRQRVEDLKCYDSTNFMSTFKKQKRLFKSLDDPERVELSPDGMSKLAKVITEITQ